MNDLYPMSSCPDCRATFQVVEVSEGSHVVRITHDDACPTLACIEGKTRSGGRTYE